MIHERRKQWSKQLSQVGEERGFFSQLGDEHAALYAEGNGSLVVTFDNLDDARQGGEGRLPWGTEFVTAQGWSSLGLMAHGWTWYRDPHIYKFFEKLAKEKFFENFDKVVFYGTSMGGYAATAFSSAASNVDVLALSPQSTLDRDICTGWEPRFVKAWRRDFKGPFGFGPREIKGANKVFIVYDPMVSEDAMHATLYRGDNVNHIRCPRFGHNLGSMCFVRSCNFTNDCLIIYRKEESREGTSKKE